MKVFLYFFGKPKDPNANRLAADYVERSSRFARCEMREIRADRDDPWIRHPSASRVCLDPRGKSLDSKAFCSILAKAEQESRDLVFIIGGHDGLPPGWRDRADLLLSLSPMTLPHELARAMLAEQIYRAFATLRGHPYPR